MCDDFQDTEFQDTQINEETAPCDECGFPIAAEDVDDTCDGGIAYRFPSCSAWQNWS